VDELASYAIDTPWFWILQLAALFIGMSKGGLPGVGMLSVPMLALVMSPLRAAALLLPIFILTDIVGVWLYRKEFSAKNLRVLIPAGLLGVGIGWATAAYVSDAAVSLLLGLLGISFCLNRWLRNQNAQVAKPASTIKGYFWGTIAGFTSFVSHAGSPPYQIYVIPQKLDKSVFVGTAVILFTVINLAKVLPYTALQPYTAATLKLSAILLPVAVIGTILGRFLLKKLPERWFYLAVQIALFLISIKLVSNALM